MEQTTLLYDERFLESYAGSIVTDPATAIVELVANCWDAYATQVDITWPDSRLQKQFKITDNGHGMTRDEFRYIWRTIAYNRLSSGGLFTNPPTDVSGQPRTVYGKNGKGRFASFCFANEYQITSIKNGQKFSFRVYRTPSDPLVLEEISFIENGEKGHGTEIVGMGDIPKLRLTESKARELIGSRFLANPAFKVKLNESQITFGDIPELLSKNEIDIVGYGKVVIFHIDTKKSDKTTKQHGIAWWVEGRAVGECKWSRSDYEKILDGRTSEAKRYTFIVKADFLNSKNSVLEDWSGFREENEAWKKTREVVQDCIGKIIFEAGRQERDATKMAVIERVGNTVNTLSFVGKERISMFIDEVVDSCPNFGETEIAQLATILAKLEKAKSRYGLLDILHKCESSDYDGLHEVLSQWTVGMAKLVLDEIQNRLKLIGELRIKLVKVGLDEVHELQPLFERGLWMFGAQFESIDFTSNLGMTQVIKKIFKNPVGKGSRNRPDFVVTPDSSVGFYTRPSFDDNYDEDGVDHLVIIDLKTTGLNLGSKEKDQVWKYVKELREKGYLKKNVKIDGFVLGDKIDPNEGDPRHEGDGVKILPMLYETILRRAERRLLNLHNKVKNAPFLVDQKDELMKFIDPLPVSQADVIEGPPAVV